MMDVDLALEQDRRFRKHVFRFAQDELAFLNAFQKAFLKLSQIGLHCLPSASMLDAFALIPAYDPCAGKAEGQQCKLCDLLKPDCVETSEVNTCQDGQCRSEGSRASSLLLVVVVGTSLLCCCLAYCCINNFARCWGPVAKDSGMPFGGCVGDGYGLAALAGEPLAADVEDHYMVESAALKVTPGMY